MLKPIYLDKALRIVGLASLLAGFSAPLAGLVLAKDANQNSNQGFPTRRVGGGTRSPCPTSRITQKHLDASIRNLQPERQSVTNIPDCPPLPLIALIPDSPVLTVSPSPTLFFYIPQFKQPQTVEIEFVLRNGLDELVYEKTFPAKEYGGIISLTIPASASFQGLAIGQNYHWYLSIIYDRRDRAHDDVVEGWIRRVPLESTLSQKLAQTTPIEQVKIYQGANLWQDSLATLAEMKRSHPDDPSLVQMWAELLQSVDLGNLAEQPLLN
jgi:hypothetical protein